MPKAIWFISYKLVEGASIPDFLNASRECNNEVLSKQRGFISWKVLADGDTWVDLVEWETMEDALQAESNDNEPSPIAQKFYAFIDPTSLKSQVLSIEKCHQM